MMIIFFASACSVLLYARTGAVVIAWCHLTKGAICLRQAKSLHPLKTFPPPETRSQI
ncbi:hypothetical protein V8C35DRAFT_309424 [Trichoderma chlorosporum]